MHLVAGVSAPRPGIVDFDVEVDAGGSTLYVSEGQLGTGPFPQQVGLVIFDHRGAAFVRDPGSARVLREVNSPGTLTYAASISRDGLELFFTRFDRSAGVREIYRAARRRVGLPFVNVQRVAAITGFAEAPSLSSSGRVLYYHRRVGGHFAIYLVTRP